MNGQPEPWSWFANTYTYGLGEGCSRPFWLKHEADEYVRKHGGYVRALYPGPLPYFRDQGPPKLVVDNGCWPCRHVPLGSCDSRNCDHGHQCVMAPAKDSPR